MKKNRRPTTCRLTHPLTRDPNGQLRRASWGEALEKAVAGFRHTRQPDGSDAFAMLLRSVPVRTTIPASARREHARGGIGGRDEQFEHRLAGPSDEAAQTETTSVCAYCGVGCNLTLHVQDNEIVKVTSPHDDPVTHGTLCITGRFGLRHVQTRD
ncbi:Periplasmic nitrate reductase [Streptomyces xanthochromogenes]